MLRITVGKIARKYMSIIWFDKCIGCCIIRAIQVTTEVIKVLEAPLQSTNVHAAYGKRLWKRISFIDSPTQIRFIKPIVNRSMLKCIAFEQKRLDRRQW